MCYREAGNMENEELEDNLKKSTLPLIKTYPFLEEKGLGNEVRAIRDSKDQFLNYKATLRRGKIVDLLEKTNLLGEFLDKIWPFGKTDKGQRKIEFYRKTLRRFYEQGGINEVEEEDAEEEDSAGNAFALEEHLRDYLAKNPSALEPGLKVWSDKTGRKGVEYPIDEDGRRVDIIALDKSEGPVIVELKVSHGHERAIGQSLYYRNQFKRRFEMPSPRIIIVAKEISPELRIAAEDLQNTELFEYALSFKLTKITEKQGN